MLFEGLEVELLENAEDVYFDKGADGDEEDPSLGRQESKSLKTPFDRNYSIQISGLN